MITTIFFSIMVTLSFVAVFAKASVVCSICFFIVVLFCREQRYKDMACLAIALRGIDLSLIVSVQVADYIGQLKNIKYLTPIATSIYSSFNFILSLIVIATICYIAVSTLKEINKNPANN